MTAKTQNGGSRNGSATGTVDAEEDVPKWEQRNFAASLGRFITVSVNRRYWWKNRNSASKPNTTGSRAEFPFVAGLLGSGIKLTVVVNESAKGKDGGEKFYTSSSGA